MALVVVVAAAAANDRTNVLSLVRSLAYRPKDEVSVVFSVLDNNSNVAVTEVNYHLVQDLFP